MQSLGGSSPRRPWRFSTEQIAEAAGLSVRAVRKHIKLGVFDPRDVRSLARYVTKTSREVYAEELRRLASQFEQ